MTIGEDLDYDLQRPIVVPAFYLAEERDRFRHFVHIARFLSELCLPGSLNLLRLSWLLRCVRNLSFDDGMV